MSDTYTFLLLKPQPNATGDGLTDALIEEQLPWRSDHQAQVKAALPAAAWRQLRPGVEATFRRKVRAAHWRYPAVDLGVSAGKQLITLFWAAESTDPDDSEMLRHILVNWQGLAPEMREWLYTLANQDWGKRSHGPLRGWRGALKQVMRENPIAGDGEAGR